MGLDLKRKRYRFSRAPYPSGWFQVARSGGVQRGEVLPLEYFGLDLVLFRTSSGKAVVLDGACPHLGVHLGYGGEVVGETIECPSHAWRFDSGGACVRVPYGEKVPEDTTAECWSVIERGGLVMVWFHVEKQQPLFQIPDFRESERSGWSNIKTSCWTVRTRNQKTTEGAFDEVCHRFLSSLHNGSAGFMRRDGHVLHITSERVVDTSSGTIAVDVRTEAHGFGFTVTRFGEQSGVLAVGSITPVDDLAVDLCVVYKLREQGKAEAALESGRAFVADLDRRLETAVSGWDLEATAISSNESGEGGHLEIFRTWCKQFYTQGEVAA